MKSLIALLSLILTFLLSLYGPQVAFLPHDTPNSLNAVLDISHYQGSNLDFGAAKAAGIVGVIHKATEGTTYTDDLYTTNKAKVLGAGLLWGAYHFATGSDPIEQATHFLNVVQPDTKTLLVLDFESNPSGASMTVDQAVQFVEHIKSVHGKYPVLYGGGYLKDVLGGVANPTLSKCPLWIAQYASAPELPPGWSVWSMWQYTDGSVGPEPHTTPGCGATDKDKWNGSAENLVKFWTSMDP